MQADHKKIERLLKTARGQIDGILRMVEEAEKVLGKHLIKTACFSPYSGKHPLKTVCVSPYSGE